MDGWLVYYVVVFILFFGLWFFFFFWSAISSFLSSWFAGSKLAARIPPQVLLRRDCQTSAAVRSKGKVTQRDWLRGKHWPLCVLVPVTHGLSFLPGRITSKVTCLSLKQCQHYDPKVLAPSRESSYRSASPGLLPKSGKQRVVGVNFVVAYFCVVWTLKTLMVFPFFC